MADPFVAEIRIFPFNFAPQGLGLLQRATSADQSEYRAFFRLLGTTYGGNGQSNFALPNLQGRAPMYSGQGPGLSLYDLGQAGGSPTVTLIADQLPAHSTQRLRNIHDGRIGVARE